MACQLSIVSVLVAVVVSQSFIAGTSYQLKSGFLSQLLGGVCISSSII
ncbi:MAG: hypothetical protein LBC61_01135 [Candidatus Peribacteria bacterium]|nr:hypothetical protein [Candidatus Peribacteria bacterium]